MPEKYYSHILRNTTSAPGVAVRHGPPHDGPGGLRLYRSGGAGHGTRGQDPAQAQAWIRLEDVGQEYGSCSVRNSIIMNRVVCRIVLPFNYS